MKIREENWFFQDHAISERWREETFVSYVTKLLGVSTSHGSIPYTCLNSWMSQMPDSSCTTKLSQTASNALAPWSWCCLLGLYLSAVTRDPGKGKLDEHIIALLDLGGQPELCLNPWHHFPDFQTYGSNLTFSSWDIERGVGGDPLVIRIIVVRFHSLNLGLKVR